MLMVFAFPTWIFSARSIDRLGKTLHTRARNELLSNEATPQTKASVFGFHRSMDNLVAVFVSIAALIFLYFYLDVYKSLSYFSVFPDIITIIQRRHFQGVDFQYYLKER